MRVLGADGAARYGRVEHGEAGGLRRRGDGAGAVDVDGRAVDQQRLCLRDRLDEAALVEPHLAHVFTGGQHGDDDLGALRRLGGARGRGATCSDEGVARGGIDVVARDPMARLDEIGRHGRAHVAEADETDGRHENLAMCDPPQSG